LDAWAVAEALIKAHERICGAAVARLTKRRR
jgi:hypothetical protein